MSIASEIQRINNAKTSIASAIGEKGVDVPEGTKIDDMSNMVRAIQAMTDESVVYVDNVLKTLGGTEIVTGNAKIATGSYVGTGTSGEANPNTLTFDFVPKIVLISGGEYFEGCKYFWGDDKFVLVNRVGAMVNPVAIDNTTMSWYYQGTTAYQLNEEGKTYYWVAIC